MGVSLTEANALKKYRKQIHQYGEMFVERSITPWTHINLLYKLFGKWNEEEEIASKIHNFTGEIIAKRKEFPREENNCNDDTFGKQRYAMLDTLLIAKNDGIIDAAGIQEEVDTFIFGGHDTSMTAITFTLFMIAHHSDVQKRLYEEIIGAYGNFIPL